MKLETSMVWSKISIPPTCSQPRHIKWSRLWHPLLTASKPSSVIFVHQDIFKWCKFSQPLLNANTQYYSFYIELVTSHSTLKWGKTYIINHCINNLGLKYRWHENSPNIPIICRIIWFNSRYILMYLCIMCDLYCRSNV